jgi:hypothetical protein
LIAEPSQFQPVNAAATSTAGSVGLVARVVGATTGTVEAVVDVVSGTDGAGSLPAVAGIIVADDSLPHAPTPIIATIALTERHIGLSVSTQLIIPSTPRDVEGSSGQMGS